MRGGSLEGSSPGPLFGFFFFPISYRNKPCQRFHTILFFTLSSLIKSAKELLRCSSLPLQGHFWAGNNSTHADARSEAPRDLTPKARTLNSSLLLPSCWLRTAHSAAARRTLGWDSDFSRLFVPGFVAHPSLTRALSTSLPSSQ